VFFASFAPWQYKDVDDSFRSIRPEEEECHMDGIRTLLETQPLFSLFLTVALGFLVGEINIKGFSLGSGAVIFVGLAIGGFAAGKPLSNEIKAQAS
jgi:hypothetical protein